VDADALTPVEYRAGRWYKREDDYRGPSGVNGAKLRACRHLLLRARADGARRVVSAASVLSPQSAMAATLAADLGMGCTVIVGGTTPELALRHRAIRMAADAGAEVRAVKVGYNPALQRAALEFAEATPDTYRLPYGITTPGSATPTEVWDFLNVGARQVANVPSSVRTMFIPFGSGNTAAGVIHGLLHVARPSRLERVVLVGIGPDRLLWLAGRVALAALPLAGIALDHVQLHPQFATYGMRMPATADGIRMHPTYEGKIVRYYDKHPDPDWQRRDGTSLFWIVGGPLP